MDTNKIRQRMSHLEESLDVGRDIEPHEVRGMLSDLDDLLAVVGEIRQPRNADSKPNIRHWEDCAVFNGAECDMRCADHQDLINPRLPPDQAANFVRLMLAPTPMLHRTSVSPMGGDGANDLGEPPPGYEAFTTSQFAQDLVKSMREALGALSQAWAVAKNPAKARISNAKSEVDRLLRVLGAGAKFAIMTNKEAR